MKNIKLLLFIIISIFVDQIIKYLIVNSLSLYSEFNIINNFLKLTYIENTGAAFGIFNNQIFLLIIITIILIIYLIIEIKNNKSKLSLLSLSMILSGAVGNLIDRIFRGYVVDYISFTLFNKSMPVFNYADIMITFGVAILIYTIIAEEKKC